MLDLFSKQGIIGLLVSIPGLLLAISMHECAHGYAAYFMGDQTAKYSGRLSLNPLKHLDIVGALCMLFFRFGWAKPVPINSRNFKNPKVGIIVVSIAGPLANFVLGFLSALGFYLISPHLAFSNMFLQFLKTMFQYSAVMNVGFMVFNLIPIPPLDGSKILMEFLPYKVRYHIYRYEQYFGIILIIFVYAGVMTPVLGTLRTLVLEIYDFILSPIFSI